MQLGVPQGDGATLRTHLERLRASTGRVDPQLLAVSVPLPTPVAPLWGAFLALRATAPSEAGITFGEMEGWERRHGVRLTPWEADTLLAMDRAALDAQAAARSKRATGGKGATS